MTEAEREKVMCVINYLERGGSGKFIDATSIERLGRIFNSTWGNTCGGPCPGTSFQVGMQESPFATLLRLLLLLDSAAFVLPPTPELTLEP